MLQALRVAKPFFFVAILLHVFGAYSAEPLRARRGWFVDYESLGAVFAQGMAAAADRALAQLPAAMAASVDRVFEHLEQNLRPGSAGDRAMEHTFRNLLSRLNRYVQEGEDVDRLFKSLGDNVARNLREGGSVDGAVQEANALLRNFFDRAEADINRSARNVIRNAGNEAVRAVDQVADRVENSAQKLDQAMWVRAWQYGGMGLGFAIATTLGVTATYYAVKYISAQLVRPKLIIESSKQSLAQMLIGTLYPNQKLPAMIFSPDLEQRLMAIIQATINIHQKVQAGKSNVAYRNLMLWGPPGTGKTMFAKRLARNSGLEWAFMSGASFAKFKDGEEIQELDNLFKWANKSKGLLLFIDEAESFLAKRENLSQNGKAYQLLNNFLNYTGERSSKFMIVFATNHKDDIDSAMHRRIDDLVELPLPQVAERARVLALYRGKILLDAKQNGQEFVDSAQNCLHDKKIEEIAQRTQGLSNGDLEGMIYTIKTDADITESGLVDTHIVDRAVQRALEKYQTFIGQTVQHAYA